MRREHRSGSEYAEIADGLVTRTVVERMRNRWEKSLYISPLSVLTFVDFDQIRGKVILSITNNKSYGKNIRLFFFLVQISCFKLYYVLL